MGSKHPEPPKDWPKYLRDGLPKQDPQTLREIAQYADELAVDKIEAVEAELDSEGIEGTPDEWDDEAWAEAVDDAREKADVPESTGSITVNVIDGRGYYYLKWWADGDVKSQYVAPVEPKERGSSD